MEIFLKDIIYPRIREPVIISFRKTHTDSKFTLKFDKVSDELIKYRLNLEQLVSGNRVLHLNRDYYSAIQNQRLTIKFYIEKLQSYNEGTENKVRFRTKEIVPEEAVFDQKIRIDKMDFIETESLKNIVITYSCLDNIDVDYRIHLYGYTNNALMLEESQYLGNHEYYTPREPVLTSTWEKGKQYQVIFPFNRDIQSILLCRCGE